MISMPTPTSRRIKLILILFGLSCLVFAGIFWYGKSRTLDDSEPPPISAASYNKSMDWRDYVADLYQAAAMPPDEGVKLILQHHLLLRTYIAIGLQLACASDNTNGWKRPNPLCDAKMGDPI